MMGITIIDVINPEHIVNYKEENYAFPIIVNVDGNGIDDDSTSVEGMSIYVNVNGNV